MRPPNVDFDVAVPEALLRVRWDRPIGNPAEVLIAGANESPYFRDARLPMLDSLIAQRAASAGAPSLLSAAVEIFPHQIRAALTVLSDPVQRYLLADEVGLGKTVEAGFVIRQTLLDNPRGRVVVLVPDVLRVQWFAELFDKFMVDDFPGASVKISAHETPEKWAKYQGYDLLVVDEAHRLVGVDGPDESPYRELRDLAHSTPRLLLLSATPVTSRLTTHLGLLHLLDADLYRWEDRSDFQHRFDLRKQLAMAVYSLDSDFESLLRPAIGDIAELVPQDQRFQKLADQATGLLTEEDELLDESTRPQLALHVEALRAHVSETYRLHRRTIRHRRAQVLGEDDGSDVLPFEVRGRSQPQLLVLDSGQHQAGQDALLCWQARVMDWLQDERRVEDLPQYGSVLAILASRAGGLFEDLADTLRWRLEGDSEAAHRAALTPEERALLTQPQVAPAESEALAMLAEYDTGAGPGALADVLLPIFRKYSRIVVFCGPGSLATTLLDHLRTRMAKAPFAEHTRRVDPEVASAAVDRWRNGKGALFVDDTGEDGLNLQHADAVIHLRLPWSPNRLEQRLGRVDRYSGTLPSSQLTAADQYVLVAADAPDTLAGAWLALLEDGFHIFTESVSTLQDSVDQGLPAVWAAAVADGPQGLLDSAAKVSDDLRQERMEIDRMDMLESIHDSTKPMRDVASAIGRLETAWRETEAALVGYAGSGPGGLRFAVKQSGERAVGFAKGPAAPLMSPHLFAQARPILRPQVMQGVFNRTTALRSPRTRLFRIGNPFVDLLANVIAIDDRGQAAAFWRRDHAHSGEPEVFFGMDYLVEADIEGALDIAGGSADAGRAIRRQADRILEPFLRRVWLRLGAAAAVGSNDLLEWLDRPYNPARGDENFNADKMGRLLDLFGDRERFGHAVKSAEQTARSELHRITDLAARCAQAREQGERSIAISRAQAQARQAAGKLVGDAESYLMDVEITDALVSGLAQPRVRLMAATCLVRGSHRAADRV